MKVLLLILLCASTVAADGVNKPKRKHKTTAKKVEHATKPAPRIPDKPKPPSLLTTKYDLANSPTYRPVQPLLDIPPLSVPIVTTEMRVYPFEHHNRKWAYLIFTAALIPLLIHDSDSPPTVTPLVVPPGVTPPSVTPQVVPLTSVPEAPAWCLLVIGLVGLGWRLRK